MQDLRGGVASKVTDAGGFFIGGVSELFGRDRFCRKCALLELMVLAVQAVKGTGMVKNRQIAITDFRSFGNRILGVSAAGTRRADKIAHTVGGQRVKVVVKITFVRPAAAHAAVFHVALTAKACVSFGNSAVMKTESALTAVF